MCRDNQTFSLLDFFLPPAPTCSFSFFFFFFCEQARQFGIDSHSTRRGELFIMEHRVTFVITHSHFAASTFTGVVLTLKGQQCSGSTCRSTCPADYGGGAF